MRQVFSLETEREKDLQAVADAMASCELKLDYKMCQPSECQQCETARELEACRKELCACDSLRVKQMAVNSYREMRFSLMLEEPGSKAKRVAKEAGVAVATGIGTLLACAIPLAFFIGVGILVLRMLWL